jgi:hypothetical protein
MASFVCLNLPSPTHSTPCACGTDAHRQGAGRSDIRVVWSKKHVQVAPTCGVKKEDIMCADGNLVQIDAETKGEKEFKGEGGSCAANHYGSVSQSRRKTWTGGQMRRQRCRWIC